MYDNTIDINVNLDDAIKFGHKEIQKILESYIEEETEHTLQDNIKKEES
jgi:hypothetical protein